MKILITSGNTTTMIDKVRGISNIFKGKTGNDLADYFYDQGHEVTLLTSNPVHPYHCKEGEITVIKYKTYDQLLNEMQAIISLKKFDCIIHSAAVSDYKTEGTFVQNNGVLTEIDSSKKIGSEHTELYLRLVPTEKIVDKIRTEWGFKGILVKFKLQVGISDAELLEIAEKSRVHSNADLIVANCLEWASERAYILDEHGAYSCDRSRLGLSLLSMIGRKL